MMSTIRGLAVFVALLLVSKLGTMADDTLAKAQAALEALRADLESGRAVRADIFAMPYEVMLITRVSPGLLEGLAASNMGKTSVALNRQLADALVKAIEGADAQVDAEDPDLRWGAAFLDQAGTTLHSIYLDNCYVGGAGRRGYIDGIRIRLSHSLVVWFESNFSNGSPPCAERPAGFRKRFQ